MGARGGAGGSANAQRRARVRGRDPRVDRRARATRNARGRRRRGPRPATARSSLLRARGRESGAPHGISLVRRVGARDERHGARRASVRVSRTCAGPEARTRGLRRRLERALVCEPRATEGSFGDETLAGGLARLEIFPVRDALAEGTRACETTHGVVYEFQSGFLLRGKTSFLLVWLATPSLPSSRL